MPRSKASYKAAAKKAAATRKRNARKPMRRNAPAKPRSRRRVTRKSKSMLSELFNPKMAQAGGKAIFSGAVGGMGAAFVEKIMANQDTNKKLLVTGGLSFVTATVLKMPNVGAGMAGVAIYKAMESSGMLADDGLNLQEYQYANPIESLPMVLNENGDEMMLQDDGMMLQEDPFGYEVGYFGMGFGG